VSDSTKIPPRFAKLYAAVGAAMDSIRPRVPLAKLTLIIRQPGQHEAIVIIGDDTDPESLIAAIRTVM